MTTVARITWCTNCPEHEPLNDACPTTDIAIDGSGLMYVGAQCPFGGTIYTLTTGGALTLFTGSPTRLYSRDGAASVAGLFPGFLAIDASANLYIVEGFGDSPGETVRRISPSGSIMTIAGGSQGNNAGIGGYTSFFMMKGIAVDGDGRFAITDTPLPQSSQSRLRRAVRATAVGSTVAGRGDFNGDGNPDLLWRNTTTGNVLIWFMNGAQVVSGSAYISVELRYSLGAVADLDGDGKSDLVWYDHLHGVTDVWLMDGAVRRSSTGYMTMASPWDLAASADFNGDGKSDLLWRNAATGANLIWYMDGGNVVSGSAYFYVDFNFHVAAAADFNGDNRADIVWYDGIGGVTDIWLMQGHTFLSDRAYMTMAYPWDIAGAADMNGDGRPDLVWRNAKTGATLTWFITNGQVTHGSGYVYVDKTFTLPTIADFNRDGHADFVWYNGDSGVTDIWLMNNGDQFVSHGSYLAQGFPWDVFAAR